MLKSKSILPFNKTNLNHCFFIEKAAAFDSADTYSPNVSFP